tara:strand:+ start:4177 stop:4302 length:126 start_codon:yes stop_codon:yes gene_type:complete
MNNNDQWNILIERLYKVEEANKGLTTRVRLLEGEINKLKGL